MRTYKGLLRRDFLKLASLVPLTWFAGPPVRLSQNMTAGNVLNNIIILVFDAWSANHVEFYGYPRQTMPNLERLLEHATVFHNHYSAGTFTTSGTASLLTGMHPWTHRALSLGSGGIVDPQVDHQAFAAFSATHSTLAYTQNKFADLLLFQSEKYLDTHLKADAFNMDQRFLYNLPLLRNDPQVAFASLDDNVFLDGAKSDSSLFINPIYRLLKMAEQHADARHFEDEYPLGLPDSTAQFSLRDVVDGAITALGGLTEPAFAYFHFYPPHENYRPLRKYYQTFDDGWRAPEKPIHRLAWRRKSYEELTRLNQQYDEYIASWDAEISRLFQYLQDSGLFERSYVIVTADHGELNERGEKGHFTPMIFQPLIHIPLVIFQPGGNPHSDIYTPTSSTDVLPTLAHLAGIPIPDWAEGKLLPGFGGVDDQQRSIFSMDAKTNASYAPLTKITLSLTKNRRRLTFYNYPDDRQFEFYDLDEDPEELHDLYPSQPADARHMQDELLGKLDDVNRPFTSA